MSRDRRHVLIAGGGVAGLETLLALRALAPDRLDITILAPELKFVNRSMSAQQPFKTQRGRGFRLEDAATDLGARWRRGTLDRVVHEEHRVVIRGGESLRYDTLVLALGARPKREWESEEEHRSIAIPRTPSPRYAGERAGERGRVRSTSESVRLADPCRTSNRPRLRSPDRSPLSLTLSPEYR